MKKTLLILLAIGVIGLFSSAPVLALQLGFAPSSQTINQGSTAAVDIVATFDVGAAEIVAAYDLDVEYNPLIVTATGVTFGTKLGGPLDSWQFFNLLTGVIDLAEVSYLWDPLLGEAALYSLQGAGPITLATLFFTGDNLGTSTLSFINYGLYGNDIKGANDIPYANPTLNTGSITVATTGVPEPATMLLFGLGLAGVAGIRRKLS